MSLNLFLNYERTNGEGLFYREVTTTPYNVIAKIRFNDETLPIPSRYAVTYTLNDDSELKQFNVNGTVLMFDGSIPCVSSVNVTVKDGDGSLLQTLKLSCQFVTKFPEVSFISYPTYLIDKDTGLKQLTEENFTEESQGNFFYGEGHTEIINLSSDVKSAPSSPSSITWLIGNTLNKIKNDTEYSVSYIPGTTKATTEISSTSNESKLVPISVLATNSEISRTGPVVKYNDVTGQKEFYPFFASSLTVEDVPEVGTRFTGSIQIKPYPTADTYNLESPFVQNTLTLPVDFSFKNFTAMLVKNENTFSTLFSDNSYTAWELNQYSKLGEWQYKTKELEKITAYQFPLKYSDIITGQTPELFTAPLGEKCTVILSVSATSDVWFNYEIDGANDWKPRKDTQTYKTLATLLPLPFAEIFISNYFIEKSSGLTINNIKIYADETMNLQKVILFTDDDLTKVYEIDSNLSNFPTIPFNKIGKRTIYIHTTFLNTLTNEIQIIKNSFKDLIEVIEQFDEIFETEDPQEYRTSYSPTTFTFMGSSAPLIAPNDWAIADNVNYVLTSIYQMIENVIAHTVKYEPTEKFLGWLGNDKYTWSDLQCYSGSIPSSQWSKYVTEATFEQPEVEELIWDNNSCSNQVIDPLCLQKYCIEWKWSSRTRRRSELAITWKSTKKTEGYKKLWKYEACDLNPSSIACPTGKWHTSTLDKQLFPTPFCGSKPECSNIGFVITNQGKYLMARETEIFLLDNLDEPSMLTKQILADEIFAFSKIEKIAISRESLLYVLDSSIPKVSVFNVRPNDAILLAHHWGKLGSASNPYGFKNPKDLHITKDLEILIVDTGNKCIKKYTSSGKHKSTFADEKFQTNAPLSVSTDSFNNLHVLLQDRVLIYNSDEVFIKEYLLPSTVVEPRRITFSHNKEICYISHADGVIKFFRNGTIFGDLIYKLKCKNGETLTEYNDVLQDQEHNLYICAKDKVLKYADRMKFTMNSSLNTQFYWSLDDILIDKDEYIQGQTYIKSFHRLWDNMELVRTSLNFIDEEQSTLIGKPKVQKHELMIGQNEIVVNSVINRLSSQLWSNLESLVSYVMPQTM